MYKVHTYTRWGKQVKTKRNTYTLEKRDTSFVYEKIHTKGEGYMCKQLYLYRIHLLALVCALASIQYTNTHKHKVRGRGEVVTNTSLRQVLSSLLTSWQAVHHNICHFSGNWWHSVQTALGWRWLLGEWRGWYRRRCNKHTTQTLSAYWKTTFTVFVSHKHSLFSCGINTERQNVTLISSRTDSMSFTKGPNTFSHSNCITCGN